MMPNIAALEAFPDGAATPASYHDGRRERPIIVVRHGMVLHAYEDVCPHQYLPLTYCGRGS
jgi:nitrite reductase/ring-hydroxylating ferredoxin subunit